MTSVSGSHKILLGSEYCSWAMYSTYIVSIGPAYWADDQIKLKSKVGIITARSTSILVNKCRTIYSQWQKPHRVVWVGVGDSHKIMLGSGINGFGLCDRRRMLALELIVGKYISILGVSLVHHYHQPSHVNGRDQFSSFQTMHNAKDCSCHVEGYYATIVATFKLAGIDHSIDQDQTLARDASEHGDSPRSI
jgi:hypothetical protein